MKDFTETRILQKKARSASENGIGADTNQQSPKPSTAQSYLLKIKAREPKTAHGLYCIGAGMFPDRRLR